jgi:hypothetical protein
LLRGPVSDEVLFFVIMSGARMSEEVIRPEGIPSEEAFGSFTVSMRGYFSTQHLWSVEHFIRLAAELEAAHTGEARFSFARALQHHHQ